MKQQPKSIIVAIPVAPPSAIRNLEHHPNIDAVVCLYTPINFRAVGQYYETFEQVSDEEAIAILEAHRIPNL
jgi:predicted phosphoribosyltransferase